MYFIVVEIKTFLQEGFLLRAFAAFRVSTIFLLHIQAR